MITTSPRASWWTVLTLAGLYALFFSAYTIQRHQAFLTSAFDLGNFDQTIWNTAHGRPFALTAIPGITSHLAIHFSPILLLVAPIYWLWPDVRALLILQSVALAAGAIPLFWYAARKVGRGPAVVFAAIYLLFPALHGVNLFDFHDVALAPPLLLLAWNWLDERRDLPFAVAAILAAMTKEEIGLLVAMMGLYALLVQRRAFGLAPLVLGFGWFLVTLELLIPTFNPSGQHQFLGFYDRFGGSGPEVALYLLTHPLEVLRWLAEPRRLAYLRDLLTPVLGLSLLAPHVLMIAAPSLAVNLLSTLPAMTELEGYHYPAPIVPFVVASAAAGLRLVAERVAGGWRLGGGRRREKGGRGESGDGGVGLAERRARVIWVGSLAMLGATLAYHATHGQTPLALGWQWPRTTAHHRVGQEIIAGIPSDAAVSAQWRLVPHLSQREKIYEFPDVRDADVVLLDVTILDLNMHPNDVRRRVEELLAAGWGVGAARDGWLLLRRGGATVKTSEDSKTSEVLVGATTAPPQLPDEFYSFARLDAPPEPQFQMQANFGDTLRLLGYDFALTPDGPRLTAYWTALGPIERPVQLLPLYLDPHDGRVLEDTSLRPLIETLWYPPERWRPGEIVRTTTIPWEFGRDYVVSMSVRAAGESGEWLEPRIVTSDVIPELLRDGTAVKLLEVHSGQPVPALRLVAPPLALTPVARAAGQLPTVGAFTLLGYTLDRGPDGDSFQQALSVTLGWQAGAERPERDYTVFVQLLDSAGRLVAQSDNQPAGATRPTSGWQPGEVVVDRHDLDLPADLPAGTYRLIAGMYDLGQGGARLPAAQDGVRPQDDAVTVAEVRLP